MSPDDELRERHEIDVKQYVGKPLDEVPRVKPDEDCNARKHASGQFTGYCNAAAGQQTDHRGEGRCKFHGGGDGTGAQELNDNAVSHGLFQDPSKLYKRLDMEDQRRVEEVAAAFVDRVRDKRGEADVFDIRMAERLSIELLKLDKADDWLAEQAEGSGNLLIESTHVTDPETGEMQEIEQVNKVMEAFNQVSRELRLWMKDVGLFEDDGKREMVSNLAEALSG